MASSLGTLVREGIYVADSHHFETYQHAFLWMWGVNCAKLKWQAIKNLRLLH